MTKIDWDDRRVQEGVDRGVFYPKNTPGVAWNGLLGVKEGSDENTHSETHLDGVKTTNREGTGAFAAAVKCYTYPDRLTKGIFDLSYRTFVAGKKQIHLVYNARAQETEMSFPSISTTPVPTAFGFNLSTKAVEFQGAKVSHLVVDENVTYSWVVEAIEQILYGDTEDPRMPTLDEVFEIYQNGALLKVSEDENGLVTITGPESAVQWVDDTTVKIQWPTVEWVDTETFKISSL